MFEWIVKLIMNVLSNVSEPSRVELVNFAKNFRQHVQEKQNPYDDFLASIICWILNID